MDPRPIVLVAVPWALLLVSFLTLRAGRPRGAGRPALLAAIGAFLWMGFVGKAALEDGWNPLDSPLPQDESTLWLLGQAAVVLSLGFLLWREAERRVRDRDEAREDRRALRVHRAAMGHSRPAVPVRLKSSRPPAWKARGTR